MDKTQTLIKNGYWFSRPDGTTEYQKIPAEIGRTDCVSGEILPCYNGLHASPTPWDALLYARGIVLWEVELSGVVAHGKPVDKYVGRTRKYLRKANIPIRKFAAQEALRVIHLWSPPEIVREYLDDEAAGKDRSDIRTAVQAAAWTARAAAWTAAEAATEAAEAAEAAGSAIWAARAAEAAGSAIWAAEAARAAEAAEAAGSANRFNMMCYEALEGNNI